MERLYFTPESLNLYRGSVGEFLMPKVEEACKRVSEISARYDSSEGNPEEVVREIYSQFCLARVLYKASEVAGQVRGSDSDLVKLARREFNRIGGKLNGQGVALEGDSKKEFEDYLKKSLGEVVETLRGYMVKISQEPRSESCHYQAAEIEALWEAIESINKYRGESNDGDERCFRESIRTVTDRAVQGYLEGKRIPDFEAAVDDGVIVEVDYDNRAPISRIVYLLHRAIYYPPHRLD